MFQSLQHCLWIPILSTVAMMTFHLMSIWMIKMPPKKRNCSATKSDSSWENLPWIKRKNGCCVHQWQRPEKKSFTNFCPLEWQEWNILRALHGSILWAHYHANTHGMHPDGRHSHAVVPLCWNNHSVKHWHAKRSSSFPPPCKCQTISEWLDMVSWHNEMCNDSLRMHCQPSTWWI